MPAKFSNAARYARPNYIPGRSKTVPDLEIAFVDFVHLFDWCAVWTCKAEMFMYQVLEKLEFKTVGGLDESVYLDDWVLIATCKQLVWSNRIGRNMPI